MISKKTSTLTKQLRTKLRTANLSASDMLKGRPVFSLESRTVLQPVRDQLLAHGSTEEFGKTFSKGDLATPSQFDRSFQSEDVGVFNSLGSAIVSLHDYRLYKRTCSQVNKHTCVTTHKAACKVIYMPERKRKEVGAPARKPKKAFLVGPDGKTANQRLREVMAQHPVIKSQDDLINEVNRIAQLGTAFITQQRIQRIYRDKDSLERSSLVGLIAEALGVRTGWLQFGTGEQQDERMAMLTRLLQLTKHEKDSP